MFDGFVACLRTYSVEEMASMIEVLKQSEPATSRDYVWHIKRSRCGLLHTVDLTYLLAYPRAE